MVSFRRWLHIDHSIHMGDKDKDRERESQRTCFVEVRETRAFRNVDWMVDDRLALRQRERRRIDCLAACSRNLLQLCTAHSIRCAWHSHLLLDSRHSISTKNIIIIGLIIGFQAHTSTVTYKHTRTQQERKREERREAKK